MLTAAAINQLEAQAHEIEITDSPGLTMRVTARGTKSWRVWWIESGQLRRRTIGRWPELSAPQARHERDRLRAGMARGAVTLHAMAATYLAHARVQKRSHQFDERTLRNHLLPRLGRRPLVAITAGDVARVLDGIRDRGAPNMASRTLAVIRRVLNFAIERGELTVNPAARLKYPQSRPRDRVLHADEIAAWWTALQAVPPAPRIALELQLLTGSRLGEVCAMEIGDVDRRERIWHLRAEATKTHTARAVPLSAAALARIDEASGSNASGTRVVTCSEDTARRRMRDAVDVAGIRRAVPHDLRRTCATHLTGLGHTRETVDRILGHVDASVGGIYDRYAYADEMRAALEAWAERLAQIVDRDLTKRTSESQATRGTRTGHRISSNERATQEGEDDGA